MSSISEILRSVREQKQISLQDVEDGTKIRGRILQAIESEELDILPAPYMKSFIKTYAEFLRIPNEEYAEALRESFTQRGAALTSPSSPTAVLAQRNGSPVEMFNNKKRTRDLHNAFNSPASSVLNKILYSAVAICLMVVGYYTLIRSEPAVEQPEIRGTVAAIQPLDIESSETAGTAALPLSTPARNDSLVLETIATDTVWLSIVVDSQSDQEMTMVPGMRRRWVAKEQINLSLGNAGGMKFIFNGEPVGPLGPTGYVIRDVRVTSEGIVSSNRTNVRPKKSSQSSERSSGSNELADNDADARSSD